MKNKRHQRHLRHARVKKKIKISGKQLPRLSVFRSNKHISAQIIDDLAAKTLVSSSDLGLARGKSGQASKPNRIEIARGVGKALAAKAKRKNILKVVFDRGGYQYHGRVKALAEGAREKGLIF